MLFAVSYRLCSDVRVFGRALPLKSMTTTLSIPNSPLSEGGGATVGGLFGVHCALFVCP